MIASESKLGSKKRYDQEKVAIPSDRILKFNYNELSKLAKRQLDQLLKKLLLTKEKVFGERRESLYISEIHKLLEHEKVKKKIP
ncbi:MAG: hypothetical protein ACFFAN_01450 [Promethearchaeota archaeon]